MRTGSGNLASLYREIPLPLSPRRRFPDKIHARPLTVGLNRSVRVLSFRGDRLKLHRSSLGLVLFGIWLLWSGHYTPLLIVASVLFSVLCLRPGHGRRMGLVDDEAVPLLVWPAAVAYAPLAAGRSSKANVDVARFASSIRGCRSARR